MLGGWSGSRKSVLLVALMAAIVVVLAVVQYEWSVQVSRAEHDRMQRALDNSVRQFREDFNRELRRLSGGLQPRPLGFSDDFESAYARAYEEWRQRTDYAGLVRSVFLSKVSAEGDASLLQLDPESGTFETVEWPEHLRHLQDILTGGPPTPDSPGRLPMNPFTWTMLYEGPVLAQMLTESPEWGNPRGPRGFGRRFRGYVFLELDKDFLRDTLLPNLVERHFAGLDGLIFQVSVTAGDEALYRSAPDSSLDETADAREPLLWRQEELASRLAGRGRPDRDGQQPRGGERRPRGVGRREDPGAPGGPPPDADPFRRMRGMRDAVVSPPGVVGAWELVVRHSAGSLEQVVAAHQNRNLAVSFGVLLLLCVSMGMILVSAQRAQRLAKAQMDFVAGVSHELRTPLAVICSAAENLADGVVGEKARIAEYGTLIRDEGRRLTGMIEQTLQFAAGQSNRQTYELKRQPVAEIVEDALQQAKPALEAADYHVDKSVAADLPAVEVDAAALSQTLQNLIGNAVKYGGTSRWVGIRAESAEAPAGGQEVRISVEDKGLGISPDELSHVFDPFFRGKQATSRQIRGTGLGLSLARDAVVAMGGHITVKSANEEGSTFTIHLPAARANGTPKGESV